MIQRPMNLEQLESSSNLTHSIVHVELDAGKGKD